MECSAGKVVRWFSLNDDIQYDLKALSDVAKGQLVILQTVDQLVNQPITRGMGSDVS